MNPNASNIDKEIIELITEDGALVPSRCSEKYLERRGYASYIRNRFLDNTTDSFSESIYRLFNHIDTPPICANANCNNVIKFNIRNKKYSNYCSPKCRNNSEEVLEKNKKGVSEALKKAYEDRGSEINAKRSKTLKQKYGQDASSPFSIKEIQDKAKSTTLTIYGVDNVMKLKEYHTQTREISRTRSEQLWKDRGIQIQYIDDDTVMVKQCCPIHGDVIMSLSTFNNRTKPERIISSNICTLCNPINEYSGEEKKLKEFFDSYHINYISNSRSIIPPKELDFYLPDYNIAIEMNGLYFHNIERNGNKNYHKEKTDNCLKNNIQLIHIWEDDWVNRRNIVLSMLKNKLGLTERKIYARNCEIRDIDSLTLKDFLENNHIQGNIYSSIKYGLFYGNELVSVMSFGNKRISLGSKSTSDEMELYRFCCKLNTIVVGGASKLFKHAVDYFKTIGVRKIITYAKRDWSCGNLYTKLGFEFVKATEPNYFYINKAREKLGRFSCRKSIIAKNADDKSLSEEELMDKKGYFRLYDSGNLKFEFNIKQQ